MGLHNMAPNCGLFINKSQFIVHELSGFFTAIAVSQNRKFNEECKVGWICAKFATIPN